MTDADAPAALADDATVCFEVVVCLTSTSLMAAAVVDTVIVAGRTMEVAGVVILGVVVGWGMEIVVLVMADAPPVDLRNQMVCVGV